ncbi:MAG: acetyl-CoA carboxylase, carboxyltransferase subunit beta [Candidatus Izemoplasmatales bacterium]|jgi:acetyl-CoA carboxylase carboxyl transferase subunit beta|nr:acetyl-CoA carboxylase, carboxyltransferase subunit beta [Candidatus Izemoplasmatales bacterium]
MNKIGETIIKRKKLKQNIRLINEEHRISRELDLDIPEGLYDKCPKCGKLTNMKLNIENDYICKNCGYHFRMRAIDRIKYILDEDSFVEKGIGYITLNPLYIDGYEAKINKYKKETSLDEAYIYGFGQIYGEPCIIGVMDSHFMMGSMGSVVGEKVAKTFEYAIYKKLPVIIFTASGGARMQEGIFSLMQMAKTSSAVAKHSALGYLYISVLTDPTTGGVTASFASLGDIILSEPNALIGFAGPRVIEQTINQKLPEGFQRAEFLMEKGFIDQVVNRKDLKKTLHQILHMHRRSI